MRKEIDFNFTLNVSAEGYEKKTDATCCLSSKGAEAIGRKKMCFFENSLTVDEFLLKAQSGHSFCAIYRFESGKKYWYSNSKGQKFLGYPYYQRDNKTSTKGGLKIDFKRDEYFSGSQVIFIDIDLTKYEDINEYIDTLTFKPTMVYMSYSDGKEKNGIISRRFHLCYVFDTILNADEFKLASKTLSNALVKDTKEELDDKCGEKMSQYMNGCYGNLENYKTYLIYSLEDIKEYNNINKEENKEYEDVHKCTTYYNVLQNDTIDTYDTIIEEIPLYDEGLLSDMGRLDYDEFMKYNRHKYNYYYRVEKDEWVNNSYQFVDDSYFAFKWQYGKNAVLHDGQNRRKKVYMRMCLRRVMNPNVDANTILFNAYEDIHRFFDWEGLDLYEYLKKNIEYCFNKTIEEIEEEFSITISKLREETKPKRGIIYKNRMSHTVETTYSILDEYYQQNMTVSENLDMINNYYGFTISERTIYNYISNRGIKTDKDKLSDNDLILLTDFSISAIENLRNIKKFGYKIGNKRYNKIYKEYKNKLDKEDVRVDKSTTYYNKMQNDTIKENQEIKSENYSGEIVLTKTQQSIYGKLLNSYSSDSIEPLKKDIESIVYLLNSKSSKPTLENYCMDYLPNGNNNNWDIF